MSPHLKDAKRLTARYETLPDGRWRAWFDEAPDVEAIENRRDTVHAALQVRAAKVLGGDWLERYMIVETA